MGTLGNATSCHKKSEAKVAPAQCWDSLSKRYQMRMRWELHRVTNSVQGKSSSSALLGFTVWQRMWHRRSSEVDGGVVFESVRVSKVTSMRSCTLASLRMLWKGAKKWRSSATKHHWSREALKEKIPHLTTCIAWSANVRKLHERLSRRLSLTQVTTTWGRRPLDRTLFHRGHLPSSELQMMRHPHVQSPRLRLKGINERSCGSASSRWSTLSHLLCSRIVLLASLWEPLVQIWLARRRKQTLAVSEKKCDLSDIGGVDLVASWDQMESKSSSLSRSCFPTQQQGSPILPSARRRMRSAASVALEKMTVRKSERGCVTLNQNFMSRWRDATGGRGCVVVADPLADKMSLSTMVKLLVCARRLYQALQLGENLRNQYEFRPNV